MTEINNKIWLKFLWSFSLSDHMGDACEAVRKFAEISKLPIPSDDAELNVASEDQTPENSWLGYLRSQGITDGVWSDE